MRLPPGHMTLQQIRDAKPCREGWVNLLEALGGCYTPLDTVVSLGDVARSNGAADARWCARELDWSNIVVRRAVVASQIPMLHRAAKCARDPDPDVDAMMARLEAWCAGGEVNLRALERDATAVTQRVGMGWKFWMAFSIKAATSVADGISEGLRLVVGGAEDARTAKSGKSRLAAATIAAESARQRADLIAAFPPLHARPAAPAGGGAGPTSEPPTSQGPRARRRG